MEFNFSSLGEKLSLQMYTKIKQHYTDHNLSLASKFKMKNSQPQNDEFFKTETRQHLRNKLFASIWDQIFWRAEKKIGTNLSSNHVMFGKTNTKGQI